MLAQWQQEQRPVRYHMKIQASKGFTDVIADSPPLMRLTTDGYVEVIWVMWDQLPRIPRGGHDGGRTGRHPCLSGTTPGLAVVLRPAVIGRIRYFF